MSRKEARMSVIEQFCDEYHAYNDISPDRRVKQRRVLLEFEAMAGDLAAAGGAELQTYLASRLESGLSPTTVGQYRGMIQPFFRWAWQRKLIDGERLMEIQAVEPPRGSNGNGRPRPYSRKEVQRFWRDLDERFPLVEPKYVERFVRGTTPYRRVRPHARHLQIEAIAWLALGGGLRRDEILRLTIEDMHPDNAVVVVHSARKNAEAEERLRSVPYNAPMRDAVKTWLDFRALLKPQHDCPWLSLYPPTRANRMPKRTFEHLLLTDVGAWELHRMRHTCATELLRAGMPIEKVQRIMGHSRVQQTLAYTQLLDGDVIEAAERAEPRFTAALVRMREAA